MSYLISNETPQKLGWASLITFGTIVGWISISYVIDPQVPSVGKVVGILAFTGVSIPLIGCGVWLRSATGYLSAEDVVRVVTWGSGGMFPLSILAILLLLYTGQQGLALVNPFVIVLWMAGGGAVGGLITGIYDVQRRKAHRRHQATAEELSALIEAAPVSIIEHTSSGTVQLWNQTAEQVFGWKAREVVGSRLPFHSEGVERECDAQERRRNEDRQMNTVEVTRRTKGGELRDFLLSSAPVYDSDGETTRSILQVFVDITDKKQRREDLALFKTLLDHSNDSIFVIDPTTGEFIDVNDTASEKLGYEPEELLELSVTDIEVTFSSPNEWKSHIASVRDAGSMMFDGEHQCKDGSTFPVEVNIAYVSLDTDHEYIVALARDITERKKRQQELSQFRKAVDQAGHAIYLTDVDGTIEYVNPAFEDVTGYSAEIAIGNDPSILQSGDHDDEYYARLWSTILDGRVWEEHIRDRRKSGELYMARQTIAPIYEGDSIAGFVAIQSDTTSQKLREQRISVLNRILRHNLRTAVTVISGNAELLLEELDDEELRTWAEVIAEHARTLQTTGEKAQQLQRALDSIQSSAKQIPITDAISRVITVCTEEYPAADISVDNSIADSIVVDTRIRPAIEELVRNAIEHNDDPRPTVRISFDVEQCTEQVSISVRDEGPRIPDLERVAFRDSNETPLQHGSGIGMWLIKWITTALGGRVAIEENDPQGNVVTITLPVVSAIDATSSNGSETPNSGGSSKKVPQGYEPDD